MQPSTDMPPKMICRHRSPTANTRRVASLGPLAAPLDDFFGPPLRVDNDCATPAVLPSLLRSSLRVGLLEDGHPISVGCLAPLGLRETKQRASAVEVDVQWSPSPIRVATKDMGLGFRPISMSILEEHLRRRQWGSKEPTKMNISADPLHAPSLVHVLTESQGRIPRRADIHVATAFQAINPMVFFGLAHFFLSVQPMRQ